VWYYGDNGDGGLGNTVILKHTGADGSVFYTLYAHMNSIADNIKQLGMEISIGDVIGQVGHTSSKEIKDHLHFEILTPPKDVAPRRTGDGGRIGIQSDTHRSDPNSFGNWPSSDVYDESQIATDSEDSESMELLDRILYGYPPETIERAKKEAKERTEKLRKKQPRNSSPCRETLVRRGKYVERIEPDCSTRGSFYSP